MRRKSHICSKLHLTVGFDQHLLLAHVLHVDSAVDDVLRRGTVVLHLLTLVALDLKGISCTVQQEKRAKFSHCSLDGYLNMNYSTEQLA